MKGFVTCPNCGSGYFKATTHQYAGQPLQRECINCGATYIGAHMDETEAAAMLDRSEVYVGLGEIDGGEA